MPELWRTILIVILIAFIIGFSISLYLDWKCEKAPTDEEYEAELYGDTEEFVDPFDEPKKGR